MAVTLGKHSDYAVRAMLDLARNWGGPRRKAHEIADATDISLGPLKSVLAGLVAQGLLSSIAGRSGGYRLTRPPQDITLLDVVDSLEHYRSPEKCVLRGGPCDWSDACLVHETWCDAQREFAKVLDATNLDELNHRGMDSPGIGDGQPLVMGTHSPPDAAETGIGGPAPTTVVAHRAEPTSLSVRHDL
jgi:Rrf2 family protein